MYVLLTGASRLRRVRRRCKVCERWPHTRLICSAPTGWVGVATRTPSGPQLSCAEDARHYTWGRATLSRASTIVQLTRLAGSTVICTASILPRSRHEASLRQYRGGPILSPPPPHYVSAKCGGTTLAFNLLSSPPSRPRQPPPPAPPSHPGPQGSSRRPSQKGHTLVHAAPQWPRLKHLPPPLPHPHLSQLP